MDKALAKAWVADLRSGKFKQAVGELHKTEGDGRYRDGRPGYCCLGVLSCRIADRPEVKATDWKWDGKRWVEGGLWGRKEAYGLPGSVRDEIGLTGSTAAHLAAMNDRDGKTFRQIADYIERELIEDAP